jgi:hypothetical protein
MLTTKSGVRFATITPALLHMLVTVERLSRTLFGLPAEGLVITSGSDSTHMAGSKHYTGEAIDLRSKTLGPLKGTLVATLRAELGTQFTVLLEQQGTPNEHIHCQVRKGRRFDPDALVDDANTVAIATELKKRGQRHEASTLIDLRRRDRNCRRIQRERADRRARHGDESGDRARAVGCAAR